MALKAENLILLTDVINAVNTKVRNQINNQIVWSKTGAVPNNFPNEYLNYLGTVPSGGINSLNGNSLSGSVASFSALYNLIVSAFSTWSHVRKCTYTYTYRRDDYHGGNTVTTQTHVAYCADANQGIIDGIKNKLALANLIMKAGNTEDTSGQSVYHFANLLYNTWNSLKDKYSTSWSYTTCYAQCHSNCHGSGGWR